MSSFSLPSFISRLLSLKDSLPGASGSITEAEARFLCESSTHLFINEPILLEISTPVTIIGDTHGQFHDLLRIFSHPKVHFPGDVPFLFLGDYVDRGRNSIETVCLLFAYKIMFPTSVFMLRGNHECSYINSIYGFREDCMRAWENGIEMWHLFSTVFNVLPIAAIVQQKIFCVHGGISPDLKSLDDIRAIERPIEIPNRGLLCDLVWSDPDLGATDWQPNERLTSVCFGPENVREFLEKFGFDLICRGHQAVMEGFEFPFGMENNSIVTVFSAPNYCYEFDNKAAVLHVNENLYCEFSVVEPKAWQFVEMEVPESSGTPPRQRGAMFATPQGFPLGELEQVIENGLEDDLI